ncbi:MAG: hypothetical protein M3466_12680, partial [Gemmatimonadota bacterium]|nr:hypothetical protein [Gemmatimonadota bacterium]
ILNLGTLVIMREYDSVPLAGESFDFGVEISGFGDHDARLRGETKISVSDRLAQRGHSAVFGAWLAQRGVRCAVRGSHSAVFGAWLAQR